MSRRILRVEKIEIGTARIGRPPTVRIVLQQIIESDEGELIQILPEAEQVFKLATNVFNQVFNYSDPVLGVAAQISIAGLQSAMTAIAYQWVSEQFPGGYIDGKYVLNED